VDIQSSPDFVDTPSMRASESVLTKTKTDERRRSERKPYTVEAYIISPTATDPNQRKEVTSVNLSRHGLAFDFTEALAKKTYWMIEIDMGDQRLISEIRIMACRAIENGLYQIGAEFC
jgi:PilZ domain